MLRRAEEAVGRVGLDAAWIRRLARRAIREGKILPALRTASADESGERLIYEVVIPLAEILGEIEGRDLEDILTGIEEVAVVSRVPILWKEGR